jgi:hypothetical protein
MRHSIRLDTGPRAEAGRLVKRARALLTGASDEMAAIYLDHAAAELRRLDEQEGDPTRRLP